MTHKGYEEAEERVEHDLPNMCIEGIGHPMAQGSAILALFVHAHKEDGETVRFAVPLDQDDIDAIANAASRRTRSAVN